MEKKMYSYRELSQISYHELRKISILLRLPANIKKKYMISMILAHQKGDSMTKAAITHKVIEERKKRRMSIEMKRTKPFLLGSGVGTHQVSTDLSVAMKHEFETRYSYVAHYTKGNKGSGASGIIREETEVSRRNRSVMQQTSKSTRKLAPVDRTEIMLPRNHSFQTLIQLMPQHERNFIPSTKGTQVLPTETNWNANVKYESMSTSSGSEYYCQGGSPFSYGNLSYPTECGSSFQTHDIYRDLPYLHARQYENYLRCNTNEKELFSTERDANSSVGLLNGTNSQEDNGYGGYLTKNEVKNYETNVEVAEPNFDQNLRRRYDALIKQSNEFQHNENLTYYVDIFLPRNEEGTQIPDLVGSNVSNNPENLMNPRNVRGFQLENSKDCVNDVAYPLTKARKMVEEERSQNLENGSDVMYGVDNIYVRGDCQTADHGSKEDTQPLCYASERENNYILGNADDSLPNRSEERHRNNDNEEEEEEEEEEEDEEEEDEDEMECGLPNGNRHRYGYKHSHVNGQKKIRLPSFAATFQEMQSPESFVSEICVDSPGNGGERQNAGSVSTLSDFSSCRFISGHNQYPEFVSRPYTSTIPIPIFVANYSLGGQSFAYTNSRISSIGITGIHYRPIMSVGKNSRYGLHQLGKTWNESDAHAQSPQEVTINNNLGGLHHHSRSVFYSYAENHSHCGHDGSGYASWNEYNEELDAELIAQSDGHEMRVIQCKRHGYHCLYPLPTSLSGTSHM